MRVSPVIGTGYVGLVSGACFADVGHDVVCVDLDADKVARIERGEAPIYEPGLDSVLERNAGARLRATTDLAAAVHGSDLTLIAVGTPFDGRVIDLGFVVTAARQIGEALRTKDSYHCVVVKSTVVPGTTDSVVLPALEAASGKRAGADFGVGMNPEFLSEGEAVRDFMEPDRIVIGGIDERAQGAQLDLYAPFADVTRLLVSNTTAEMIKYASNALQATLISFSNEFANLCSVVGGVDIVDVMQGVNLSRLLTPIGDDGERTWPGITRYLAAGCGFGGSCFPKDLKALAAFGDQVGNEMAIAEAVLDVNEHQPARLIELAGSALGGLTGRRVTVLGLAFKPGTDDMRESPAIPVVQGLLAAGSTVRVFDPVATDAARAVIGDGPEYASDLESAVLGAEAVVVVTSWDEFSRLPELVAGVEPPPVVVDGRRMFDPGSVRRYLGVGR